MKTFLIPSLKMKGFSLTELIVVLAIAAILMTIAAPTFTTFTNTQRLVAAANEFYTAVNLTRSEAIKRGSRVDMVANDGIHWTSGWTIFIDKNNNLKVDPGEPIIFQHDPTSQNLTISSNFAGSALPYISYMGSGRSRTNASSQQPLAGTTTFTLDTATRRIKVNFLGRARICDPATDLKTCTDTNNGS